MEDESAQDHAEEQPQVQTMRQFQSNKARRWPWALGIMALAFGHLAFFLPLRAFVPVSPGIDPWWGMGLILADGTAVVALIHMGVRTVIRMKTQKADE